MLAAGVIVCILNMLIYCTSGGGGGGYGSMRGHTGRPVVANIIQHCCEHSGAKVSGGGLLPVSVSPQAGRVGGIEDNEFQQRQLEYHGGGKSVIPG